jgi:phage-related minor tail protein
VWSQICDLENEVNDIIRDVEKVGSNEEDASGNLTGLTKLIKLHAHSIATLQQQTNDIKQNMVPM